MLLIYQALACDEAAVLLGQAVYSVDARGMSSAKCVEFHLSAERSRPCQFLEWNRLLLSCSSNKCAEQIDTCHDIQSVCKQICLIDHLTLWLAHPSIRFARSCADDINGHISVGTRSFPMSAKCYSVRVCMRPRDIDLNDALQQTYSFAHNNFPIISISRKTVQIALE